MLKTTSSQGKIWFMELEVNPKTVGKQPSKIQGKARFENLVTEKKSAGCSMIWLEQVQIVCTK
jgi:hypothetical protein